MIQSQLIGAGILVAVALGIFLSYRERRSIPNFFIAFTAVLGAAFLFARLYAVAPTEWVFSTIDPRRPLGIASIGGFFGVGLVFAILWVVKTDRRRLETLMLSTFTVLGFARIGCHFDGCDFGRPASTFISITHAPGTVAFSEIGSEPAFPFAIVLAISIAMIVSVGVVRKLHGHAIGSALLLAFVFIRLILETTRGTSQDFLGLGLLTITTIVAVVVLRQKEKADESASS